MSIDAKIHIIGVGSDGLRGMTSREREIVQAADTVLGSETTLKLVPDLKAQRVPIGGDLAEVVQFLNANLAKKRMVVLAGGDPLFYGVARYLCDRLGKDHFEVLPHVSSMQLAFARVKESWEEAYLTNLANHPLASVLDRIRTAEIVGLFPSEQEGPAEVARQLRGAAVDYFRAFVCENLGGPDERVTQADLAEIERMEFGPLSVIILKRKPGSPDRQRAPGSFRRFGNPDDVFAQSQPKSGLITQHEVRAIALAQLDIQPGSIVWDIGAGSGAVAIEAAQLASKGTVYAIEQDAADYHLIVANAETFGVTNLKAVHGSAPRVFDGLPAPDAIFVGGPGKEIQSLLEAAFHALRPGGHLVVSVATMENLSASYRTLQTLTRPVQATMVNVARGVEQLESLRFEAVNPSFLLWIDKPAEKSGFLASGI